MDQVSENPHIDLHVPETDHSDPVEPSRNMDASLTPSNAEENSETKELPVEQNEPHISKVQTNLCGMDQVSEHLKIDLHVPETAFSDPVKPSRDMDASPTPPNTGENREGSEVPMELHELQDSSNSKIQTNLCGVIDLHVPETTCSDSVKSSPDMDASPTTSHSVEEIQESIEVPMEQHELQDSSHPKIQTNGGICVSLLEACKEADSPRNSSAETCNENSNTGLETQCETTLVAETLINSTTGPIIDTMQDDREEIATPVFSMVKVVESVCDGGDGGSNSGDDSSDSESHSSSSSDDTSSSDDSCEISIRHRDVELAEEVAALKNNDPPKVKGEILPNELPAVEDLNILLPDDAILETIGKVAHIMPDHSIIIQSYPAKPALDFETVLFFSRDIAIGKVEETFGPVPSPYYVVRFNSEEHLHSRGVELNKEVSYAPHIKDFTSFVFLTALRRIRGSDASWCNDQEPPPSCIEYSDDEQERDARRRKKNHSAESENKHKKPVPQGTQNDRRGGGHRPPRGRGRDSWRNESTRFNVTTTPDQTQTGWQAAVNEMSRQDRERFRHPPPPLPPNLFTCFQSPLPEFSGPHNTPQQPYAPHPGNFVARPPMNWRHPPPSYPQSSMFGFGFPPPPPPPPP